MEVKLGKKWGDESISSSSVSISADGSKIFATSQVTYPDIKPVYRLAILPRPQPVTPGGTGTGAGGTTTPTAPSTGSASSGASVTTSSSTSSKKPEKLSSNLAETGVSVWVVGGVAVIAVAAGVLVLRKRL